MNASPFSHYGPCFSISLDSHSSYLADPANRSILMEGNNAKILDCFRLIDSNDVDAARVQLASLNQSELHGQRERLLVEALDLFIAEDHLGAIEKFHAALGDDQTDAWAHYFLAGSLNARGMVPQAFREVEKSVQLEPCFSSAWFLYGGLAHRQNDRALALQGLLNAVDSDIDNGHYWQTLNRLAFQGLTFPSQRIRRLLIGALERRQIEPRVFSRILKSALPPTLNPAQLQVKSESDLPATEIQWQQVLAFMDDELLLSALQSTILDSVDYELSLTAIRRYLLDTINRNCVPVEQIDRAVRITSALACYACATEFLFFETDQEKTWLLKCEQRLQESVEDKKLTALNLAIVGCYRLLADLPSAKEIAEQLDTAAHGSVFQSMLEVHIGQRLREHGCWDEIHSFSDIDDEVSRVVQRQYEQNPYPRWTLLDDIGSQPIHVVIARKLPNLSDQDLPTFRATRDHPLEVLVAGCGTGRHALLCARHYRHAMVYAMDLSRASLAYAEMKRQEYGIDNAVFRQGDLLALPSLNRQFDVIESVGVLHHMQDPAAGLAAIEQCLKPGGWMKLALYSSAARNMISKARKTIRESGYSGSADDIRKFRYDLMADPEHELHTICNTSTDFYNLSECRDLLFHVQEHQFTVMQLKEFIGKFDLEFMGFDLESKITVRGEPEITDWRSLGQWAVYEEAHPDTFSEMYVMWLRKPG